MVLCQLFDLLYHSNTTISSRLSSFCSPFILVLVLDQAMPREIYDVDWQKRWEQKSQSYFGGSVDITNRRSWYIILSYLFSRHEVVFLEFYQFSNNQIKTTPPPTTFKQQRTNHYTIFTYLIGSIFLAKIKFALWILWQLMVRKLPLSPSSSFP